MTDTEAVVAALSALRQEQVALTSETPLHVETNARMLNGTRGYRIQFGVSYPALPDLTFVVVEVRQPSGEVLVVPAL